MHVRRKLVAGNWKMNGSLAALGELSAIAAAAKDAGGVDVTVCPPFTLIAPAVARSSGLVIGAQDCHFRESGAHTGNVSAPMLVEAGARLIITALYELKRRGGKYAVCTPCIGGGEATAILLQAA